MTPFNQTVERSDARRSFLRQAASAGVALAAAGLASSAKAATMPQQPEAETGHEYPMPLPHAMNEAEFRMGVIGPATLSRVTSEMAIDKTTNGRAKEFANFELREAIAVTTVLSNLHTPVPPMDKIAKATLKKIQLATMGKDFDRTYIQAQLENHEFLRDHTKNYLKLSSSATSMPELSGRNLATLALATFTEHVQICKDILFELKA
ncbi:DUF305 domain-containing protein [Acidisoma silvae]|uniref:DUF4142 domain-containing protein n=1 Tax=Acidisoma silvae TaxID=2802396 RepID=A0A963YY89_9PROT|nr:DUF4142 domain-containing protein [Acidisoma silvae]MCB8878423.1 DUF4142 domain-containing protein [Acidisoma silvae]